MKKRLSEEYSLFKTGAEVMFPNGSLVFMPNKNNDTFLMKENPHYSKKQTDLLDSQKIIKHEPFTILESDIEITSDDYEYFYKIYFKVIQYDKIGWIYLTTLQSSYDYALMHLSRKLQFVNELKIISDFNIGELFKLKNDEQMNIFQNFENGFEERNVINNEPFLILETKIEDPKFGIKVMQEDRIGWLLFMFRDVEKDWNKHSKVLNDIFEEVKF